METENRIERNKKTIVYTTGTYDLFHVGHLNILKAAKGLGDVLVVGVSTDELVEQYKGRSPVVPFEDRARIVSALRFVDVCVPQYTRDKVEVWKRIGYDVWVHGDDWHDDLLTQRWKSELEAVGVRVVFFPYTRSVSSTDIKNAVTAHPAG